MRKLTIRQQIDKRIKEEEKKKKTKPKFFRMRKYVDGCTGLVWDVYDSYAENKRLYLEAFRGVCQGKYADIFEAHDDLT